MLDFDRRPAIMARPSQVAMFLQRQLSGAEFLQFAGSDLGEVRK